MSIHEGNSAISTATLVADEYDDLRARWDAMLTGGGAPDVADPDISRVVGRIANTARRNWNTMEKSAGRTHLWSDLPGTDNSAFVTEAYARLRAMALGYRTPGCALAGDAALRADLLSALDWMNTTRYNANSSRLSNWWDGEIGVPLWLNDITVLLYNELTAAQRAAYMAAVEHFSPSVNGTGANRVWKATVVAVRGVIVKDSTKIANARDGLSDVLGYVTEKDGFYTDGSYIQHLRHPYTGGYGASLLEDIGNLLCLLRGSTWRVVDARLGNVFRWVHDSFEPLIYNGAIMDLALGRVISRRDFQDHVIGHQVIRAVIRLSQVAPDADASAFRQMAKGWIQADTAVDFYSGAGPDMAVLAKALTGDSGIVPRPPLTRDVQFTNMARAAHHRPGYAFGISMHSSRVYNFESVNAENLHGWHTADGMTYLNNSDLTQFSDGFWPTVDSTRLPGTTVEKGTMVAPSQTSDQRWVGGSELLAYGTSGMAMHTRGQTLVGRKSWFMFDDAIVALGAGITASDGRGVETVVENRKLSAAGDNVLTVDGAAKPRTIPWSQAMPGVCWAHLAGGADGSDIGYFFPGSRDIVGLRETRTGTWTAINECFPDATPTSRRYLSLAIDHGTNPTNAGYSYAILPNMSAAQVAAYADHPRFAILRNDPSGQGVRENSLNLTGAHFWVDGGLQIGDIWSGAKSAVLMKDTGGAIDISVSDPMFTNTGTFTVEIAKVGGVVTSKDPAITVTQTAPTIRLTVDATDLNGRCVKVHLAAPVLPSRADWTGTYGLGLANTSTRTVTFDITPARAAIDGVSGLAGSLTLVNAYSPMSVIVRANSSGTFDAMDATAYRALTTVSYTPGRTYHVRVEVDLARRCYDVFVAAPDQPEAKLAQGFAFRSSAPPMTDVGKVVLRSGSNDDFAITNCGIFLG